ncbi:MAG: N-acetylmuramoyl-L-alanine amidase [Anaerolineae bacterium]|nr:N-acetylmuramoyl-L-alanine amidase [Anaerolineae bacterium]
MTNQPVFPKYIFGLHEPGGEWLMEEKGKKGWILFTERVFHDLNDQHGADYSQWESKGFGIISRINHDYFPGGTIPQPQHYDDFAKRVRNFVRNSRGGHIWVIGNEMNHVQERPNGQMITPQLYAQCYKKCWEQIHSLPGHENDQVAVGSVAPWNNTTAYPGNEAGDWVKYFVDIVRAIAALGCPVDAITHHAYTHGHDPSLVFNEQRMDPPFHKYRYHFRCYRDFMEATPAEFRNVPVYITEADEDEEWENANRGWVQNAYKEINDWNSAPGNQQIRCLILYRWPRFDKWHIDGKGGVHDDFRAAMNNAYTWKEVVLPVKINGHEVSGAFLEFYNQMGREFCGVPISDLVVEDNLPTQYFERIVLQQDLPGRIIPKASGQEVQTLRRSLLQVQEETAQAKMENSSLQDRLYEVETALVQMREELTNAPSGATGAAVATGTMGAIGAMAVRDKSIARVVRPLWQDVIYQLPRHASKSYALRDVGAIQNVVINHSAVPATVTAAQVAQFHVKNMDWPGIGYHFYVDDKGIIYKTNHLTTISYHVGNYDSVSVGICVGGTFTKTIPTPAQIKSTAHLAAWLIDEFSLPLEAVRGKKEFIDTQSPGHQWLDGQKWKNLLLAEVKRIQQQSKISYAPKPVYHYVLFWHKGNVWAERDWLAAKTYISSFKVTHGFSVEDAKHAQYVTIIGNASGVDERAEQILLEAGCYVERIAGRDTDETRVVLNELALQGQRFLNFDEA